jgi:hypothetical protein
LAKCVAFTQLHLTVTLLPCRIAIGA